MSRRLAHHRRGREQHAADDQREVVVMENAIASIRSPGGLAKRHPDRQASRRERAERRLRQHGRRRRSRRCRAAAVGEHAAAGEFGKQRPHVPEAPTASRRSGPAAIARRRSPAWPGGERQRRAGLSKAREQGVARPVGDREASTDRAAIRTIPNVVSHIMARDRRTKRSCGWAMIMTSSSLDTILNYRITIIINCQMRVPWMSWRPRVPCMLLIALLFLPASGCGHMPVASIGQKRCRRSVPRFRSANPSATRHPCSASRRAGMTS